MHFQKVSKEITSEKVLSIDGKAPDRNGGVPPLPTEMLHNRGVLRQLLSEDRRYSFPCYLLGGGQPSGLAFEW